MEVSEEVRAEAAAPREDGKMSEKKKKLRLSHGTIVILIFTLLAFASASFDAVVGKDLMRELYFLAAGICGWNALIWSMDGDIRRSSA